MDDEISVVCSECGHEDWEHNDLFMGCRHTTEKTPHYKFCGCRQSPNAILYDAVDDARKQIDILTKRLTRATTALRYLSLFNNTEVNIIADQALQDIVNII